MSTQASTSDRKGKGRALVSSDSSANVGPLALDDHPFPPARESERWTAANVWRESRLRAKTDRRSWDYMGSQAASRVVWFVGFHGCWAGYELLSRRGLQLISVQAKTAIAPLDRVKILFQTSNADFRKYAGTPMGLLHATRAIYRDQGVRGLFQGHSMTLLRVFPYAGIKFMAYDWLEAIIIPTPDKRTPGRYFVTGALSGVTSVFFTYPLELIRVRLAFQTKQSERTSLGGAIRSIYHEADPRPASSSSSSAPAPTSSISRLTRSLPLYPFYRGFSISILGMIPYAGVSFLTYGTLKRYISGLVPSLADRPTMRDLSCGALAGMVSQTASYPFEVVRRRMQVGGADRGLGVSARQAISAIYQARGWRGFFVGLSIGYIKVIPMTSISFATWQFMKRAMEI